MESIGDKLKNQREQKGYSVEQIARDTNIAKRYLEALEAEDFAVFPGDPYLIGFLRNYADYLGIDPDEMVSLYRNFQIQSQPVPMDELLVSKNRKPYFLIFGGIVIIAALVVGGYFLIPKIVSHFRDSKELIELGNLDVSRDFTDVRDIAQAYFSLYESPASSEVVNLCSGKAYELKSVIEMMNEIADYEIEVRVNPAFVRDNEIKVLSGDNSHLMGLTGFKPSIDFKQTLQDMYNA